MKKLMNMDLDAEMDGPGGPKRSLTPDLQPALFFPKLVNWCPGAQVLRITPVIGTK